MEELTETCYTVQEASELLKVHYQTVRNWIKTGQIRVIKIGRSYRIPKSEIEHRLTGQEMPNS